MVKEFDKKGTLKVMALALAISLLGIGILGWQYRRMEKKILPALEEKIEQNSAQDILERFLNTQADILLTERAMEQKINGGFSLGDDVRYYEILKTDKLADGKYQFRVKTGDLIQIITLVKIFGNYYIDSIQTGG